MASESLWIVLLESGQDIRQVRNLKQQVDLRCEVHSVRVSSCQIRKEVDAERDKVRVGRQHFVDKLTNRRPRR